MGVISNLSPSLWYRADAGINSGSPADGDLVTTWYDQVGSLANRDLAASGTARPTWKANILSGRPVVRFDGSANYMRATFTAIAQPTTIVLVGSMRSNANAANKGGYFFDSADSSHRQAFGNNLSTGASGTNALDIYAGSVLSVTAISPLADFRVFTMQFNGNSSIVRWNSQQMAATAAGGAGTLGGLTLGYANSLTQFFGPVDIAEVVVFPTALSAANMLAVEWYLANRYFGQSGGLMINPGLSGGLR